MSQDIGMALDLHLGFGAFSFVGRCRCHRRGRCGPWPQHAVHRGRHVLVAPVPACDLVFHRALRLAICHYTRSGADARGGVCWCDRMSTREPFAEL